MDFQSLITVAPWTFITQICNLFIQAYLFKRFLFKPIQNIIRQRQEQVNKIYDDAAEAQKSAEADKAAYEKLLADARGEAAELVRTAAAQPNGEPTSPFISLAVTAILYAVFLGWFRHKYGG